MTILIENVAIYIYIYIIFFAIKVIREYAWDIFFLNTNPNITFIYFGIKIVQFFSLKKKKKKITTHMPIFGWTVLLSESMLLIFFRV